jgi:hypothetical protein
MGRLVKYRFRNDLQDLGPVVSLSMLRQIRDRYAVRQDRYPGLIQDLNAAIANLEDRIQRGVSAEGAEDVTGLERLDLRVEEHNAPVPVGAA